MKLIIHEDKLNDLLNEIRMKIDIKVDNMTENAKMKAPGKTGRLKNSIHKIRLETDKWQVQAQAPYAYFVEVGTSDTKAQPFLRKALQGFIDSFK